MITRQYEQYQPVPWGVTWLGLILTAVLLIVWGLVLEHWIPNPPRYWEFGSYLDTPGESVFSTYVPPEQRPVPAQIELPPNRVKRSARIE
jgi:hypothetical protein